jgi:mycofactocin precursor
MDHEQTTESGTLETVDGDETVHGDETVELVEELLIEEISIDGMCGVY